MTFLFEKKMNIPTELELLQGDLVFKVRFDYAKAEKPYFNYREGVGSPGNDESVTITEIDDGSGWKHPDNYPGIDIQSCESDVMDRIAALIAEVKNEKADYDYKASKESYLE